MPFPPEDHNICSCCGTEFGYHDRAHTHHDLRKIWIAKGCPWFSARLPSPDDWNAYVQMLAAGLIDVTEVHRGVTIVVNLDSIRRAKLHRTGVGKIAA
jgi:hypothetical protein